MVQLQRFIDKHIGFFGVPIVKILDVVTTKKKRGLKKVLIVKLWALGDSIVLLPAIEALRERYPHAVIDVLVRKRNRAVFENQEYIDNIQECEMSEIGFLLNSFKKYDVVIDAEPYLNVSAILSTYMGKKRIGLKGQWRSMLYHQTVPFSNKRHFKDTYLKMAKKAGVKKEKKHLVKLKTTKKDEVAIEKLLWKCGVRADEKKIGMCVTVAESVKSRMWPVERFVQVADKLVKKENAKIIFIGSKKERKEISRIIKKMKHAENAVNTAGKTTVRQLFYLIAKCDLFISNDTGPMHIAAAQGCKTIGLFGPNSPDLWRPVGAKNIAIYKGKEACTHSPCIRNIEGKMPKCIFGKNNKCMKAIRTNDVLDATEKIFSSVSVNNVDGTPQLDKKAQQEESQ